MQLDTRARPVPALAGGVTNTTTPLIIITSLFFMWGVLTSLNDVLIPHLKAIYSLSYTQAMLIQSCFFGAYFVVSLPAGALIKRIGYQNGVVTGLVVAAAGCALFYPAATHGYGLFLFALFMLASGIAVLQVAANPYVTALGDPRTASSRLTLTQAFNSLGTTVAPAIGGILILNAGMHDEVATGAMSQAERAAYLAGQAASVQGPYLVLASTLLFIALLFAFAHLPRIDYAAEDSPGSPAARSSLFGHRNLILGALGIFAYVGAEVSIGSFLINFIGEPHIGALPAAQAAHYVSFYWGGAMLGRFLGFFVMRKISPGKALAFNASLSVLLLATAMLGNGALAMWALIAVGFANSIMFPTIFSMALHKLGAKTGQGSGLLCMAIVGGAIIPLVQGFFADGFGLQISFLIPAICYGYILYFGLKYSGMYDSEPGSGSAN